MWQFATTVIIVRIIVVRVRIMVGMAMALVIYIYINMTNITYCDIIKESASAASPQGPRKPSFRWPPGHRT